MQKIKSKLALASTNIQQYFLNVQIIETHYSIAPQKPVAISLHHVHFSFF